MEVNDYSKEGLVLKDLIDYQKGAVVSKTLINKQAGTITLFSFDKGEKLSEHTAPFDALVLVFDGSARIMIDGKANAVNAGELIIMPAGKSHALEAVSAFKMMLVMIKSA
jgi:quercetin dioxygenase-like cupin family protein